MLPLPGGFHPVADCPLNAEERLFCSDLLRPVLEKEDKCIMFNPWHPRLYRKQAPVIFPMFKSYRASCFLVRYSFNPAGKTPLASCLFALYTQLSQHMDLEDCEHNRVANYGILLLAYSHSHEFLRQVSCQQRASCETSEYRRAGSARNQDGSAMNKTIAGHSRLFKDMGLFCLI